MNHCIFCGQQVARGRTTRDNQDARRCRVCMTAVVMRSFRYISPKAKAWAKKEQEHELDHDHLQHTLVPMSSGDE